MTFSIDTGASGSEGPWISWSARGTQDGSIPPKSFYLRDGDGAKTVLAQFEKGVILDIHNMKTGWQRSDGIVGQAPEWKWNASIAHMQPQPGDDFKKGFEIRCAISKTDTATWQQAGAAVWGAFTALVPALQDGPAGKLPVVKMTGTKPVQFKRGSTVEPILEVIKWVDRPDCLKEQIATEPEPAAQAPAPAPAMADDDEW